MGRLIGRQAETGGLRKAMERAVSGAGSALLLVGEPGIGKSRLVEEAAALATDMGFQILSGSASRDSMRPFRAISDALYPVGGGSLFEHEAFTGFDVAFLLKPEGGVALESYWRDAPKLDTEAVGRVLAAVQAFVSDSFAGADGSLGRLECGGLKVMLERVGDSAVAAVFEGAEHPRMRRALSSAALLISDPGEARRALDILVAERFPVQRDLEGVKLDSERVRIAHEALELIRRAAASGPHLIILEDLHWADESSLFVLRFLARNLARERVFVLATSRPSEGGAAQKALDSMKAEGTMAEMRLAGLDSEGVRGLADALLSPNRFPAEFHERLRLDCGGNPLFVTEMLRQMRDDGAVALSGGEYILVGEGYRVPSSVGEVVSRRLESLDPEAMAVAEYASCMGREFPLRAVMSIPSVPAPSEALGRLAATGMVIVSGGKCEFSHALFQAALYEEMSPRWRSSWHKALGEHYEAEFRGREDAAAYELARHFGMTSEYAKASEYNAMAGEKAMAVFAAEQAATFFGTAVAALRAKGDADAQAAMQARLGDALQLANRYDEAASAYREALRSSEGLAAAGLHLKLAQTCMAKGDYPGSLAECDAGLDLAEKQDTPVKAKLLNYRGGTLIRLGKYDEALGYIQRALEVATAVGDSAEVIQTRHNKSSAHWFMGNFREALADIEATLPDRERLGDVQGLAKAYNNMGVFCNDLGETAKAMEWHEKSLAMKESIGDRHGMAISLGNIGVLHYHGGNLQEAKSYFERAREISRSIGDRSSMANAATNIANILGEMDDYEGCLRMFRESITLARSIGKRSLVSRALDGTVEPLLCLGRSEEALANAREALAIAVETGSRPEEIASRMALGRAQRETGSMEEARAELSRCLEMSRASGERMQEASSIYELAILDSMAGDRASAIEGMRAAKGIFAEGRTQLWVRRCDRQLALLGEGGEPDPRH